MSHDEEQEDAAAEALAAVVETTMDTFGDETAVLGAVGAYAQRHGLHEQPEAYGEMAFFQLPTSQVRETVHRAVRAFLDVFLSEAHRAEGRMQ